MRRRGVAIAALLLGLLAPSTALAGVPLDQEQEAAYQAALAAWGVPSGPPLCAGVDRQVVPTAELAPYGGWATIPTEPGTACSLRITDAPREDCRTYELLLHEVGHLTGHDHSSDPNSIMNPASGNGYYCQPPSQVPSARRELSREVRRCQRVHRPECWRGVREMRRGVRWLEREEAPRIPPPSLP